MKPVRWMLLPALILGAALFLAGCPSDEGMMDDGGSMEDDGMGLRSSVQMQLPA